MPTHYIHKTYRRDIGHLYDVHIEVPDEFGEPLNSYRCICVVCKNGTYLYQPPRDTPTQAKAKSEEAATIARKRKRNRPY